jgi:hypothetical protein
MLFQFQYMPIVSLTMLLVLILTGVGSTNSAFSQISGQEKINIELLPDSSPRFFECDVTPTNGTSSINGLNSDESAQSVLTDGSPDTAIMGDARFSVHFSEPLMNHAGPELRVIELSGAESFNSSVNNSNMGEKSITISPPSGNVTNSCNYSINEAQIDLQDFGISEGSSVSSINFDNRGEEDSLLGADIADISILETTENNITTPLSNNVLNIT